MCVLNVYVCHQLRIAMPSTTHKLNPPKKECWNESAAVEAEVFILPPTTFPCDCSANGQTRNPSNHTHTLPRFPSLRERQKVRAFAYSHVTRPKRTTHSQR